MITITHVRICNYLSNEKSIHGYEVVAHSQYNFVAFEWSRMVSKCRKTRAHTKQRVEKGVRKTEMAKPTKIEGRREIEKERTS